MSRSVRPLTADRGSAGAAMIFSLLGACLLAGALVATLGTLSMIGAVGAKSSAIPAVSQRISDYLDDAEVSEKCYDDWCVAVTAVNHVDGADVATLEAVRDDTRIVQHHTIPNADGLVIVGLDADGEPVWGRD